MGTLSSGLDETHCLSAMCPHPCCWETEQRILKGIPRQIKTKALSPDSCKASVGVDEFPTLSVVNAAEWTRDIKPNVKLLYTVKDNRSQCVSASVTATSQKQIPEQRCSENPGFTVGNSANQSLRENKRQNKIVKLGTAQINGMGSCSNTTLTPVTLLIWVPGPNQILHSHSENSAGSSQISAQKLICLPTLSESPKYAKKNRKKPQNVRKRVQFRLTPIMSQDSVEEMGCQMTQEAIDLVPSSLVKAALDSNSREEENRGPTQNLELPALDANQLSPLSSRASMVLAPRNKPVVFHSVKERMQRCGTQQDHSANKYKLDPKTRPEEINWESLKRQAYLWTKHNLSNNPDREEALPAHGMGANPPGQQEDSFYLYPVPKAAQHYRLQEPLSIGPVGWHCRNCVEGRWRSQGSALPCRSKSKNSLVCNSTNLQHLGRDDSIDGMFERFKGSMHGLSYSYSAFAQHTIDPLDEDPQFVLGTDGEPLEEAKQEVSSGSVGISTEASGLQPSPPPSSLNSEIWTESIPPTYSH